MTHKETLTFNESSVRRRSRDRAAVLNLSLFFTDVLSFRHPLTVTLFRPEIASPADYRNSQVAVISPRTHNTVLWRAYREWEKSLSDARPVTFAACAFRASRLSFRTPGVRPIDKSNAYPSRPRDGLRFAPAAQRRRDPWRHRELNPRPHTRAAIRLVFVRSAPRDLVPPALLANFNPSATGGACVHRCRLRSLRILPLWTVDTHVVFFYY